MYNYFFYFGSDSQNNLRVIFGMEAKVVVSVITPSFNRLSLIPETVNSVLSQSYKFFEYIIVDDGSTAGTLDWLRSLDDARVDQL